MPVRQKNDSKVDYCNCPRHMPLSWKQANSSDDARAESTNISKIFLSNPLLPMDANHSHTSSFCTRAAMTASRECMLHMRDAGRARTSSRMPIDVARAGALSIAMKATKHYTTISACAFTDGTHRIRPELPTGESFVDASSSSRSCTPARAGTQTAIAR